jgi:hypothetical protein
VNHPSEGCADAPQHAGGAVELRTTSSVASSTWWESSFSQAANRRAVLRGHAPHLAQRLADRGQRRRQQPGDLGVVEPDDWVLKGNNSPLLMGLAIPLQATILPVYLIIIKLGLHRQPRDDHPALDRLRPPTVGAGAVPPHPRRPPRAVRVDAHRRASDWKTLWHLAFPLTEPVLVRVTIDNGLGIWNGFLLPLILTQSPEKRLLPLGL